MIVNTLPSNKNKLKIIPIESLPIFESSSPPHLRKSSSITFYIASSSSSEHNDEASLDNYDVNLILLSVISVSCSFIVVESCSRL